jgi:uncharacterized protein YciI
MTIKPMKQQYIYVIKLIPRLLIADNWTEIEESIVNEHFTYLKEILSQKKLILAGKTDGSNEKTFGIVIFEADSLKETHEIMNNDPVIIKGIMIGELFPYRVALSR